MESSTLEPRTLHGTRPVAGAGSTGPGHTPRDRDADGMAVASFVLGLVGLLVAGAFLGPLAVVLALVALGRGTGRRGRALLGLALGVADLVVLVAVIAADHTLSWSITG